MPKPLNRPKRQRKRAAHHRLANNAESLEIERRFSTEKKGDLPYPSRHTLQDFKRHPSEKDSRYDLEPFAIGYLGCVDLQKGDRNPASHDAPKFNVSDGS
ncbi:hypothetical protein K0M31_018806 [Melipona bicolor]|uniref:Uncharacterized protein n=1 Tax=Melipona bicolor TaxID=60889 RepID=A0AA40G440_9HYME|nr:hypothetical protein K0M31_018806 [Melipona bicolor]